MPKSSRGGKRTNSQTLNPPPINPNNVLQQQPVQVTPPTPQQIAAGNVTPKGGVPFDQFEKMSDDEKAQVIINSLGVTTPSFLDDSALQKLAYFTGLSNKPQLVDEATLNGMAGADLWRSVRGHYDRASDVNHTSKEIAMQVMRGDMTMYSDSGGSVHGRAIYFDTTKGSYGSGQGISIMHAKIAKGANIQSERHVDNAVAAEIQSGSKLGQALSAVKDHASRQGIYCLAKGIDGYKANNGYHMIINRRALVMSKTIH